MLAPATTELGVSHGYSDLLAFYLAGRCGVLGDVDSDVVAAALGFFNPAALRPVWDQALQVRPARAGAELYAQALAEQGGPERGSRPADGGGRCPSAIGSVRRRPLAEGGGGELVHGADLVTGARRAAVRRNQGNRPQPDPHAASVLVDPLPYGFVHLPLAQVARIKGGLSTTLQVARLEVAQVLQRVAGESRKRRGGW